MARTFATTSLRGAVERLRPGMKVLLPPGCGEPQALVTEVCRQSDRLRDLTLLGGIHLGDFPWARPEHAALRYATWHMSPRLDDARRRGRVEFIPMRYFDLTTDGDSDTLAQVRLGRCNGSGRSDSAPIPTGRRRARRLMTP